MRKPTEKERAIYHKQDKRDLHLLPKEHIKDKMFIPYSGRP